jgi:hypothetical protein
MWDLNKNNGKKMFFIQINLLLIEPIELYFDMFVIDLHTSNKEQVAHFVLLDFVDARYLIFDIHYSD